MEPIANNSLRDGEREIKAPAMETLVPLEFVLGTKRAHATATIFENPRARAGPSHAPSSKRIQKA